MRNHPGSTFATLTLACFVSSCTEPVRDAQIARLGPEREGVSEGPEHRPGQPCVLCHSEGGPASKYKLAIGGTVFESNVGEKGLTGVRIFLLDAATQERQTTSNGAGNFFIREGDWSDLTFPLKTGVRRGSDAPVAMVTTINREGSCNACHQAPGGDSRTSIGPIVATGAGDGGT